MIQEYQTCAAGYSCDKFTDLVIAQAFCPTCNTTTILGCAITYLNESCISEAVNSSVLDSCCNKTAAFDTCLDSVCNDTSTTDMFKNLVGSYCTSSSVCFPAAETVVLQSGEVKKMEHLQVGDYVEDASGRFSKVYFFGHRVSDRESSYVRIQTRNNALTLSPSHFLFVNGRLELARNVKVGDRVELADGTSTLVSSVTSSVLARGVYNPHTYSGEILVSGIRASCYTGVMNPTIAHALLGPLRLADRMGIAIPAFLDADAPAFVTPIISRLSV